MPNRVLSLTPIAAALLAPLTVSALSTALPPRSVTVVTTLPPPMVMCGNEPMPILEAPYQVVCALNEGVMADSGADQGDNIRAALERLADKDTGLYFPTGRYLVSGHLWLRSGNVLVGSRSGVTHFVNPAGKTSSIDQTFHSANNILVEGLVLDNIAINFTHAGTSVARYNGFRNTASEQPQIWTHGADRIVGNVLWREPDHAGRGIADYGGRGALISGNLLGSGDASSTAGMKRLAVVDARTLKLAKRMTWLAAIDGMVPDAGQPQGYFTVALHVDGTRGGQITRNDVSVNGSRGGEVGPAGQVAQLRNVQDLSLMDNRFAVDGDAATTGLPLLIEAPQDTHITGNTLEGVPLQLVPDAEGKRPTKRTIVKTNDLVGTAVSVTQPVTGDDKASTTIDDLSFVQNRFWRVDRSHCMIDAPVPVQPGRTFGEMGNVRVPGNEPAKTCNLRPLSRKVPAGTTEIKPSAEGRPPERTTSTPAPGDGNATAPIPEVAMRPVPATDDRQPEAPRKRRWYQRASEFIDEQSDEIIDRLRAMIRRL